MKESIKSAEACMVFHPRDWGNDHRDAWLYGIICGWDNESLLELQQKFGWGNEEILRLKYLYKKLHKG